MIKIPTGLPIPTAAMQAQSEQLSQLISEEITQQATGSISFSRFMELALYEPQRGYYTAALDKLGKTGDFITAPEISPLFAQCIARQCQQVFADLGSADILEIGAGTGQLAVDLLLCLEKENCLPEQYKILEISPTLKVRQQDLLQKRIPHLLTRIHWLDDWPLSPLKGVMIANEVIDALPVDKFLWTKEQIHEVRVADEKGRFNYCFIEPCDLNQVALLNHLKANYFSQVNNYQSELCLRLDAWISKLGSALLQGLALIIDYGFPAREYYHPDRCHGTLMCYYRHLAHTDPLCLIGLQDITASVDFTQLAQSAVQAGLNVAGFTPLAAFLINNDLLALIEKCYDTLSAIDVNRQVHVLTSPSEMGELIKVIGLTRGYGASTLQGFRTYDKRARL
jgi:SAM-dependent MidA family methyltransferase